MLLRISLQIIKDSEQRERSVHHITIWYFLQKIHIRIYLGTLVSIEIIVLLSLLNCLLWYIPKPLLWFIVGEEVDISIVRNSLELKIKYSSGQIPYIYIYWIDLLNNGIFSLCLIHSNSTNPGRPTELLGSKVKVVT